MVKVWLLSLLVFVTMISLSACSNTSDSVRATLESPCQQLVAPNEPAYVLCRVDLVNLRTSRDPFSWTVSGSPPGVRIAPSSGTLTPGKGDIVGVVLPRGICPATLTFTDHATHIAVAVQFGNPCVTPPPLPRLTPTSAP